MFTGFPGLTLIRTLLYNFTVFTLSECGIVKQLVCLVNPSASASDTVYDGC